MKSDASVSADTASPDRIVVLDVLRAFALLGIIINHAATSFLAGRSPDPHFNIVGPLDQAVFNLTNILTFGKFFAIFSFLFGLSFAIQMQSAAKRQASFAGRFAWRLVILLAIGFVHSVFFSGDILTIYAVLGLLLIPFRRLGNRALVVSALVLTLNIPGILMGAARLSAAPPTPAQQQAQIERGKQLMQSAQRQFAIKQSGTLQELMRMNLTDSMVNRLRFQIATGRLWMTFGFFLLGLYAGRRNLFRETEAHRDIFKRPAGVGRHHCGGRYAHDDLVSQ
jgi:uncharacterized protein